MSRHEDRWGFDPGYARRAAPIVGALYDHWWRVAVAGAANVPEDGPAMLVAERTGPLGSDAGLIAAALQRARHPRRPRMLLPASSFDVPWLSIAARRLGGVPDTPANAERLLAEGHLVCVFPRREGFGTGAFAAIALGARAPIVPTAVVEERLPLGLPRPPGAVALPTRRRVAFGPAIPATGDPEDRAAVLALADEVRDKLQRAIYDALAQREETV